MFQDGYMLPPKVNTNGSDTIYWDSLCLGALAGAKEGREAMPFDLELDGKLMDLATPQGFCNAMWAVCNLKPGSGHLSAPVCSTFVIVSPDSNYEIFNGYCDLSGNTPIYCSRPGYFMVFCVSSKCKENT